MRTIGCTALDDGQSEDGWFRPSGGSVRVGLPHKVREVGILRRSGAQKNCPKQIWQPSARSVTILPDRHSAGDSRHVCLRRYVAHLRNRETSSCPSASAGSYRAGDHLAAGYGHGPRPGSAVGARDLTCWQFGWFQCAHAPGTRLAARTPCYLPAGIRDSVFLGSSDGFVSYSAGVRSLLGPTVGR